jgi:hypothetical protein
MEAQEYAIAQLCESRRTMSLVNNIIQQKALQKLTLIVPSSVLAITTRFKASLAKPVTDRSFSFVFNAAPIRSFMLSGTGPTLNDLRLMPDCMLYILIIPVEEDAMPKFPQAETQTAYPAQSSAQVKREIRSKRGVPSQILQGCPFYLH